MWPTQTKRVNIWNPFNGGSSPTQSACEGRHTLVQLFKLSQTQATESGTSTTNGVDDQSVHISRRLKKARTPPYTGGRKHHLPVPP